MSKQREVKDKTLSPFSHCEAHLHRNQASVGSLERGAIAHVKIPGASRRCTLHVARADRGTSGRLPSCDFAEWCDVCGIQRRLGSCTGAGPLRLTDLLRPKTDSPGLNITLSTNITVHTLHTLKPMS